jgi:gas vesicle protein
MPRSVEELKLESERNRAALAGTVDRLREQLSYTAEDLRHKVSPQHIKSEVSDYITGKTQGWFGALKQQAIDNPMQTIAAGTAVAVPILRLVRSFPLPLLMMSAGLALTSKSVRARASQAVAPALDQAGEVLNQGYEQTQSSAGKVKDTLSSAQSRATEMFDDVRDQAGNLAGQVSTRAAETARTVSDNVKGGIGAAKDTIDRMREATSSMADGARNVAAAAPAKARGLVSDNAALVGGLGIAIGAVIAAALPKTEVEAKTMGGASDSVKQAAKEATQTGFETLKDTTLSAADAAQKSFAEADLGSHANRMTKNIADAVQDAAKDAVSAAFSPPRTPNT